LSITEWLVTAGGQRFIVDVAPDTAWAVDPLFVVAGASSALAHSRTSLPESILSDGCDT
jgi:hypothetical protein